MAQLWLALGSSVVLLLGFLFKNKHDVRALECLLEIKRSFVLAFCVFFTLPSYLSFWSWPQVNLAPSWVVVYIGRRCGNPVGLLLKSQPPTFPPPPPVWIAELLKWVRQKGVEGNSSTRLPFSPSPPANPKSNSRARSGVSPSLCVCAYVHVRKKQRIRIYT